MNAPVVASAPASSANLGPGFDVFALALELRCRVTATRADEWSVTHTGEHQPGPDAGDAVLQAAQEAVRKDTPLDLRVDNAIPLGKGLGSSAAALTAGTAAALRCVEGETDPVKVYAMVSEIEGHRDNAAAAAFGGLLVSEGGGVPTRLELHKSLKPMLLIPDIRTYTKESRGSIPDNFGRDVVVRTISRVANLVTGLTTGDPRLLLRASGDEIHESTRRTILPLLDGLMTAASRAGAAHVAVSGSGPTVLALVKDEDLDRFENAVTSNDIEVLPMAVANEGLL